MENKRNAIGEFTDFAEQVVNTFSKLAEEYLKVNGFRQSELGEELGVSDYKVVTLLDITGRYKSTNRWSFEDIQGFVRLVGVSIRIRPNAQVELLGDFDEKVLFSGEPEKHVSWTLASLADFCHTFNRPIVISGGKIYVQ